MADDAGMIEEIARRWFEQEPTSPPRRSVAYGWDEQPEHLKAVYRRKAEAFWAQPGKTERELREIRRANG